MDKPLMFHNNVPQIHEKPGHIQGNAQINTYKQAGLCNVYSAIDEKR
jgi:hypothetical protein